MNADYCHSLGSAGTHWLRRRRSVSTLESPILLLGLPGFALAVTVLGLRPTRRRLSGALVGGAVVAGLNVLVDVGAHRLGWWWYPSVPTSYGPPWFYVATGLWYGAGVALIGWRMLRRFGRAGLGVLLAFMAIYGPVRDYLGAAVTGEIVFGPGFSPVLADALSWVTLTAVGQAVMWCLAGPPQADHLARPLLTRHRVS